MAEDQKKYAPTHKISPKNWNQYFEGSEDVAKFVPNNFITFTTFVDPIINYSTTSTQESIRPGRQSDSFSFFFPRTSVSEDVKHNYNNDQGFVAEILNKLKDIEVGIARGIEHVGNIVDGSNRPGGSHKILIEEPTYFSNTERRVFNLTLDLYDFGNIQEDIYNPILFFKKHIICFCNKIKRILFYFVKF